MLRQAHKEHVYEVPFRYKRACYVWCGDSTVVGWLVQHHLALPLVHKLDSTVSFNEPPNHVTSTLPLTYKL